MGPYHRNLKASSLGSALSPLGGGSGRTTTRDDRAAEPPARPAQDVLVRPPVAATEEATLGDTR